MKYINRKGLKEGTKDAKEELCKPELIEMITENEISKIIIGLAIEVHKSLGPGLLESAYKECLYYKIMRSGLAVE